MRGADRADLQTPLDAHSVENGYVLIVNYGVGCDRVQNILAAGKAGSPSVTRTTT